MCDNWKDCKFKAEGGVLFKAEVLPPVLGRGEEGFGKEPRCEKHAERGLFNLQF